MDAREVPPPIQMVQLLAGFQLSQALYVAAKLGIADELLDSELPVEDLSARVGAEPQSLRRLMRILASIGVFTEPSPHSFALTPLGQTLATGTPGSMRDLAIVWMETHYAPFAELVQTVRTGRPAATMFYGQPFFEWLSTQPEHAVSFTAAMGNLTDGIKAAALATLRFDGVHRLVDVGGADGAVLATVLADNHDIVGVLFDLPHIVADAPKALAERGVADRVTCVGGNFFESVPAGEGYLFSMVLHDWSDEEALCILRNVAFAGGSGARLAAVEFVVPPDDGPDMSKMIDLTMLGMLSGRERDEAEWRTLLAAAGFVDIEIRHTGTPMSTIHAVVA